MYGQNFLLDLLKLSVLIVSCINCLEEESCYSYSGAGGNIYPHGVGSSVDHKLQFTKAVSKYEKLTQLPINDNLLGSIITVVWPHSKVWALGGFQSTINGL